MTLNGVLLGILQSPDGSHEHNIAYSGHPLELMTITEMMGVKPNPDQMEQISQGTLPFGEPIVFTDDRGSFLTLRPVQEAVTVIAAAAAEALRRQE